MSVKLVVRGGVLGVQGESGGSLGTRANLPNKKRTLRNGGGGGQCRQNGAALPNQTKPNQTKPNQTTPHVITVKLPCAAQQSHRQLDQHLSVSVSTNHHPLHNGLK